MEDEFAPFIRSNQYVNFDNAPGTVSTAASLTGGMTDPLKKVEPAMVVVACALIGTVLLSVMLPLMHIMTSIG